MDTQLSQQIHKLSRKNGAPDPGKILNQNANSMSDSVFNNFQAPNTNDDLPSGVQTDAAAPSSTPPAQSTTPQIQLTTPGQQVQSPADQASAVIEQKEVGLSMDSYLEGAYQSDDSNAWSHEGNQEKDSDEHLVEKATPDSPKVQDARDTSLKTDEVVNSVKRSTSQHGTRVDDVIEEIEELQKKVDDAGLPLELKERAERSIERLRRMARHGSYTGEFETVEKYIYWITKIPWGNYSKDNLNVTNAKETMDGSHYGMDTVKNLVLDYLAVMQLKQTNLREDGETTQESNEAAENMAQLRGSSANAPVMMFVGLQGVGKTSIAKSIANSMGREFVRVAVGAVGSVQALRGQSKAFLDAEPGAIIKALTRAETMNPVILLDEIDKASGNSGLLNDIMAALLEILDPEQNSTFMDHYLDFPVDLSKVFFICTANNLGTLSAALLDRMEIIRFTSYSDEEKTVIAKNYSMPKVVKAAGIRENQLIVEDDVWPVLVRPVGFDAGLRQLERNIATMVRAAARRIVEGESTPITITTENIREFVLPDQGPMS